LEAHEAFERFEKTQGGHGDHGSHGDGGDLARTAAFMVAVIAAFLAVATFLGNESIKEAIQQQTKQADANAQKATFDTQELIFHSDQLLLGPFVFSSDAAAAAQAKKELKQISTADDSIPIEKKKLDERLAEAKKEVTHANDQHLFYEIAAVLLQISIVLASVAIIAKRRFLLFGGGGLATVGAVILVIGYLA
jgi:hypothetical protein